MLKSDKRKRRRKIFSDPRQLYLDFGQSDFGCTKRCKNCNMLFVNGVEEDEINHKKICSDYSHGVPFFGWKNARYSYASFNHVLVSENKLYSSIGPISSRNIPESIVEVRSSDPQSHTKLVNRVKLIVDQDLGFCSDPSLKRKSQQDIHKQNLNLEGKTCFLYIKNKKVVGLCTVEVISNACKLLEQDKDNIYKCMPKYKGDMWHVFYQSNKKEKALMGVHKIWCHSSHRKSGIGKKLMDTARSKLIYGMTVPLDLVAFSSPTIDGVGFARRYLRTETPLVYDCY